MNVDKKPFFVARLNCRICDGFVEPVFSLGVLASSGHFPVSKTEIVPSGPLDLGKCISCGLTQLCHDFDKNVLYTDLYGYRSGINETMVSHLSELARKVVSLSQKNEETSLTVVDIGSNDATLLKEICRFQGENFVGTGVDPSAAKFSMDYADLGCELHTSLFDLNFAQTEISKGSVDVVTSIAMFYDLDDPVDFARGIATILKPEGFWVLEQSYLPAMLEQNAFDTICHEHLEYYTLTDIVNICNRSGLKVFDFETNSSNGGSFRVFVAHESSKNHKIESRVLLALESEKQHLFDHELLNEFFSRITTIKDACLSQLEQYKRSGQLVHGYGASTKGNTLLQYFGISENLIPAIAERNPLKFGRFSSGMLLPIISEEESRSMVPEYFFVLPWHFKDSIIKRERLISTNAKFLFPLPMFEVC